MPSHLDGQRLPEWRNPKIGSEIELNESRKPAKICTNYKNTVPFGRKLKHYSTPHYIIMASNSSHSYAVGVSNFEKLIASCLSFGDAYNPSNPSLAIAAMQEQATLIRESISLVNSLESIYKNEVTERRESFKKLEKITTRISNAVKSSAIAPRSIEPILSIIRKLQGRRASPKMTDAQKSTAAEEGITIVEISSAQMSYDGRLSNLDKLIKMLQPMPLYQPNEEALSIASLLALYDELKAKNYAVICAEAPLSNARIARNTAIFKEHSGMMDTAKNAKIYIKSIFGAHSQQYQVIASLSFKKYKV